MAGTPRKKVKKVKFELTRSGIAGVGVVCFCIFLWMFLLGFWAGESVLRPLTPGMSEVSKTALIKTIK